MDLHSALATLSPIDQSALPDEASLPQFLDDAFTAAATIVDALPVPPAPLATPATRPRSVSAASALSAASSVSTNGNGSTDKLNITPSAARPQPAAAASTYAREWKEVKPGGANPHDIRVYKLTAKDNGGAWFLRRSVHEGIGFARFRRGLRREFDESLYRRRGVGRENPAAPDGMDGNADGWEGMVIPQGVRGIGVERRLERRVAKGVGRIDVLHLSAQFPGPSAPRDFVTACLSSSAATKPRTAASTSSSARRKGREFTMVSRPLTHPDAPEQAGFVRGKYESIEFIREIVPAPDEDAGPRRSLSVSDLAARASLLAAVEQESGRPKGRPRSRTVGESPGKAVLFGRDGAVNGVGNSHRSSNLRVAISADDIPDEEDDDACNGAPAVVVSPADDAADEESLENEETEANPVEWIMLTRSDPGGSVPRFMVDRGTPGSIVRDAEKFLDWACETLHEDELSDDDEHEKLTTPETETAETEALEDEDKVDDATADELRRAMSRDDSASNLSFMTASSGERECEDAEEEEELDESSGSLGSSQTTGQLNGTPTSSMLDVETAIINGTRPRSDTAATSSNASAAVQRLQTDAERAAAKARSSREKDDRKAAIRLAKEEEKQRKLVEKHAREAAKREEKYQREQAKAEEKRRKEEDKIRERKRRLEERDEKVRQLREIEDLKREVELLRRENEVLRREMAVVTGVPPPSRSSSSLAAAGVVAQQQRPASPASSSASSRGRKKVEIASG
ncbi:hypothetical protein ABW21_db0207388 [Orbilia brochopaga]|nr:hypothetical protein ABW21_db0207388 [Drechslerella brochopaga]